MIRQPHHRQPSAQHQQRCWAIMVEKADRAAAANRVYKTYSPEAANRQTAYYARRRWFNAMRDASNVIALGVAATEPNSAHRAAMVADAHDLILTARRERQLYFLLFTPNHQKPTDEGEI